MNRSSLKLTCRPQPLKPQVLLCRLFTSQSQRLIAYRCGTITLNLHPSPVVASLAMTTENGALHPHSCLRFGLL